MTLCGRDRDALDLRVWLAGLHGRAADGRAVLREFFEVMDPRALGRVDALLAAGDPGLHVAVDELRVRETPLSPVGLAGARVPTLVVTGERSPAAMRTVGEHVARATGGRHHVLASAGHAAHLAGPPFTDLLRAHITAAER